MKKTLEWFAQKHMGSENQEAEVLILEFLTAKAHELQKIFLEWKMHLRAQPIKGLINLFGPISPEIKIKDLKKSLKTVKGAHKEDNPGLLDLAPKWLVFAMKVVGINPYETPPGLYVFESELAELIGCAENYRRVDLSYKEDLDFAKLFAIISSATNPLFL